MPDSVSLEQLRPGVALLRLNRPQVLNALSDEMVAKIDRALDRVSADSTCRVLVLTGAGRGFCAGFDLSLAADAPGQDELGEAAAWMARQESFSGLVARLRSLRQPVIAAINGPASGGGFALALAAEIRISARSASFNAAFVKVGMSGCDMGVSWLLPRCVGSSHAFELMLTGRTVESAEAHRIGLVSEVVDDAQLLDRVASLADQIGANDAFAVWMTKRGGWANLEAGSLQAAMELENRTQMLARTTGGLAQAARNFVSNRSRQGAKS
jgi:enoyl-CoA hydratase